MTENVERITIDDTFQKCEGITLECLLTDWRSHKGLSHMPYHQPNWIGKGKFGRVGTNARYIQW